MHYKCSYNYSSKYVLLCDILSHKTYLQRGEKIETPEITGIKGENWDGFISGKKKNISVVSHNWPILGCVLWIIGSSSEFNL